MKVREVMSTQVTTLQACERAADAWDTLQSSHTRHAVVVNDGVVVGVIARSDLGRSRDGARRMGRAVGELMSRDVVSIGPDSDVGAALELLRAHEVGCLPVLEHGRIAGILTASDLLGLLAEQIVSARTPAPV